MRSHKHMHLLPKFAIALSLRWIILLFILGLALIPMGVRAASSWSPTLLVNTEAFQVIDDGDGSTNIELRFGGSANEILRWNISKSAFVFSDDLNVEGNLTASGTLSVEGASSLQGNVTARGNFSGATIHAEGSLSASGTLFLQGTLTGALAFHGPFTSDCDDPTASKLLWDSSTGKFSCGVDQTTQLQGDARYVNQSGDTMTGNLVIGNASTLSVSGAILTEGNFTINQDADSNNAVFTFGSDTTNETLTWQNTNDTFQFSDDVNITGVLSASGAVSFESTTSFGGVQYTWPGATAAQSGHLLSVNPATGQLSWTSGRASSGAIVSLMPEYDGAIYFSSGAIFVGQLVASGSVAMSGTPENFYRWTTSRTTNQDYWISTRVRIPSNFRSWDPIAPIQFRYRGSGGTLDLRLLDTADAPVALTGGRDLKNATFTTATITGPQSAGTYTVDDHITLLVKLTASGSTLNDEFADAGWIELNWETKD